MYIYVLYLNVKEANSMNYDMYNKLRGLPYVQLWICYSVYELLRLIEKEKKMSWYDFG